MRKLGPTDTNGWFVLLYPNMGKAERWEVSYDEARAYCRQPEYGAALAAQDASELTLDVGDIVLVWDYGWALLDTFIIEPTDDDPFFMRNLTP